MPSWGAAAHDADEAPAPGSHQAHGAPTPFHGQVTAWALDILSFKSILMGKANNDADMQMKTLDGIELLKGVSKEDKQTICTSMREKVYKAGRMIICEGDEGNTFYIIACAPSLSPPSPALARAGCAAVAQVARVPGVAGRARSSVPRRPRAQQRSLAAWWRVTSSVRLPPPPPRPPRPTSPASCSHRDRCQPAGMPRPASFGRPRTRATSAGELALLSADKRAATVTATTDSTVLMIDRGAFERVLGSLKGLQDASTQNRQ